MAPSPRDHELMLNRSHRAALATIIRILNRPPTPHLQHAEAPDLLSQCLLQLTDIGLLPWSTAKRSQLQELAS